LASDCSRETGSSQAELRGVTNSQLDGVDGADTGSLHFMASSMEVDLREALEVLARFSRGDSGGSHGLSGDISFAIVPS
jgi:hypothetical protein